MEGLIVIVYIGLFVGLLVSWFGDSWFWLYTLVPLFVVYKIVSFGKSMMTPGVIADAEPSAAPSKKKK
jgi:hypothetical protein